MQIIEMLTQAGIVALLSLFLPLAPMAMGIAYAIRPSEQRLALMRPLSLAGIFASLAGCAIGVSHVLRWMGIQDGAPSFSRVAALGLAEALVPLFVGCGCLTIAWLAVAVGLRRHP